MTPEEKPIQIKCYCGHTTYCDCGPLVSKQTAVKLYTKEMFLIAAEKCEVSMIDAEHIMKYIDEYVTPIELLTNEEIFTQAKKEMEEWYGSDSDIETDSYFRGACWYREQLKHKL